MPCRHEFRRRTSTCETQTLHRQTGLTGRDMVATGEGKSQSMGLMERNPFPHRLSDLLQAQGYIFFKLKDPDYVELVGILE